MISKYKDERVMFEKLVMEFTTFKFFSSKLHGDFHGLRHLVGNYTIHILSVQFLPTWITHASHIVLPSIHDKIKSSAFID